MCTEIKLRLKLLKDIVNDTLSLIHDLQSGKILKFSVYVLV